MGGGAASSQARRSTRLASRTAISSFTAVPGTHFEFATETPEELYYNKERLLANGARWERVIAKNISLDAPYR